MRNLGFDLRKRGKHIVGQGDLDLLGFDDVVGKPVENVGKRFSSAQP